jgi:hypothetical protein
MSADSKSRTIPTIIMALGAVLLAYALIILAPVVPTAAWSGVLDSTSAATPTGTQFPGRKATKAMTLFIHGQSNGRTFTIPASSTLTPDALKTGDTVRASVGWSAFREMPSVVHLTHGGSALVDSAVVAREERTQRGRVLAIGAAVLGLGLVAAMRARKQ